MKTNQALAEAVRSRGLKLTRQRQLILDILESSREHLDAEAVYARAKKRDPRIGIATVYRTLAFLKRIGLAEEHRLGEDHGHFEAAHTSKPHYHFSCMGCGRVVEFEAPQVMQLARSLCQTENLQVLEVHLDLRGYCEQCRPAGAGCGETP
jgi:Fe2+ or Zn2+ uptake regulation protein